MPQHLAIKCTYNNGGEGDYVGFFGTCSEENIKRNIESGRVWCSQQKCRCRQYYDHGFKGPRPVDPCMESLLFREWRYGAGVYHSGERAGMPIHMARAESGGIAVLTTRFPGEKELDRHVIGFFRIKEVVQRPDKPTTLIGDPRLAVRLQREEADDLFFWDYYKTAGAALWGTGLIRYLSDAQVAGILRDLVSSLREEDHKRIVHKVLATGFSSVLRRRPSGHRTGVSGDRSRRIALRRKYGPGGEGKHHKELKELVAANPRIIGLPAGSHGVTEFGFLSGDRADILFQVPGGRHVAVEVETDNPLPGCHQALKYRILTCADRGLALNDPRIEAVLVAWTISDEVQEFCSKYGIRPVALRP